MKFKRVTFAELQAVFDNMKPGDVIPDIRIAERRKVKTKNKACRK